MIHPLSLTDLLPACHRAVASATDGDLLWSWRIRIWDAFNREFPTDSLLRKQVLAYTVARETLPAFEGIQDRVPARMRRYPRGFLLDTKRILRGEIDEPTTHITHFEDDIEAAMGLYDLGNGVYSVIATWQALPHEVERLEFCYEDYDYERVWEPDYRFTEFDNPDWTGWDTHYWAAIVAGGSPDTDYLNIEQHREFWHHWLRDLVPAVRAPIRDVLALLDDELTAASAKG